MKIPGIDLIEKLINEHGSSSILRDRLLLLKDQFEVVLKENSDLHEKLSKSVAEVGKLQKEIEAYLVPDNFVEYREALFRKTESGYSDAPICPICKHRISSTMGFNYRCNACNHSAGFGPAQLPMVFAEVLRKYASSTKENP